MLLKGLKINFLGDSITEGAGAAKVENRYVDLIAARTGAVCRNYGIWGTRIARQSKHSEVATSDLDFCSRMDKMENDADIVMVFGGTNDYGHGDARLGCLEDSTPYTFYGAVNYLMINLKIKYPDAKVVFITPLHRIGENNPRGEGYKHEDGPILKEYVDVITNAAKKHSIPLLDFYNSLGIDPNNVDDNKKYFIDGLHPNDLGHRIIADKIEEFLINM